MLQDLKYCFNQERYKTDDATPLDGFAGILIFKSHKIKKPFIEKMFQHFTRFAVFFRDKIRNQAKNFWKIDSLLLFSNILIFYHKILLLSLFLVIFLVLLVY